MKVPNEIKIKMYEELVLFLLENTDIKGESFNGADDLENIKLEEYYTGMLHFIYSLGLEREYNYLRIVGMTKFNLEMLQTKCSQYHLHCHYSTHRDELDEIIEETIKEFSEYDRCKDSNSSISNIE